MPVGFEYGVEGERAKRKGSAKVLTTTDISRSNRELARLFVGMFEGTGLVPLILFSTAAEAAAAKKLWAAPGLEARVQSLVPANAAKPKAAAAAGSGGGGFGGGFGGGVRSKKGKGKAVTSEPSPLTRVPDAAEVVVAVAPYEAQLTLLQEFCEAKGMDVLVIVLNARLEEADKTAATRRYFEDGGEGRFQTAYAFLTQPLGLDATAPEGDPIVLWRAYPEEFVLARKPVIGPPRPLLVRAAEDGRPSREQMTTAIESERSGILGGLLG